MAIFWKIEYSFDLNSTKNPGYQILDDNMNTIKLTDENGVEISHADGFDYSYVEETTAPIWWIE